MKPPRIRTGKAKPAPFGKAPKPVKPKPTRRQVAAGNRLSLVGVRK
jgi:hypothetical protein